MKQFNKVDIGLHKKKYRRPLYYEVNSTAPWGVAQPCMMQKIDSKSRIVGNYSDLLRLSPLPVPTYANIYKETNLRFVPISQIFPLYENLIASQETTINDYYCLIDSLPCISNAYLVLELIAYYCTFNQFIATETLGVNEYRYDNQYDIADILKSHYGTPTDPSGYFSIILSNLSSEYSSKIDTNITVDNADFIITIKSDTDDHRDSYLLCKLNRWGRILRTNLIGCGYSLNIDDDSLLSILPLFAYYKAYYDTYNPQRTSNWQTSTCYRLINKLVSFYTDNSQSGIPFTIRDLLLADNNRVYGLLRDFFKNELSRTFATSALDIISACRDAPESDTTLGMSFYDNDQQYLGNEQGEVPFVKVSSNLTSIGIRALNYLTKFIGKNSVLGAQLSKKLSTLYDVDVSNSTLFDSNKIGYYRLDCKVNPIFSTSDTTTPSGEGEYLGSFAGTGFAHNNDNNFDFSSKEIGYVVGLTAIIPDSNYYQGNSYDLHCIDRDTLYNPQYDSLGYEILPFSSLVSDNGISFETLSDGNTILNKGFGYLPRYSQLKSVKNIVNGDMSRRATSDSLSAYYLDKQIVTNSYKLSVKDPDLGIYNFELISSLPPNASEEWQYPCKYSWIGNYDRIFYNSGKPNVGKYGTDDVDIDDNFMFQMSFNFSIYDNKLPISRSYCTYDDDDNIETVQQS